MADTKISALTAATAVADADELPLVQGGATKRGAFSVLWTYISGKIGTLGTLSGLNSVATGNIDARAVTVAKMQAIATSTILGRATTGAGDIEELTAAQATGLLPVATTTAKGLMRQLSGNASLFINGTGAESDPLAGGTTIGTKTTPVLADKAFLFDSAASDSPVTSTWTQIIAALGLATKTITLNAQTGTAYTLALSDAGCILTMTNAAANTVTLPLNATVAFPIGAIIRIIQAGAGATTIDGVTGVTVNGVSAGNATLSGQYKSAVLLKTGTDAWIIEGNHGTVA